MRLTENEKKELLSNYSGQTSDNLLIYLRRHFPVIEIKHSWKEEPVKFIKVEDKIRPLDSNKKYLVGYITSILEQEWVSLGIPVIRRTVKKYLDGIK